MPRGDRAFWFWQALLRYVAFDWACRCRARLYRGCFKTFGRNVRICEDVLIKYPSVISLGSEVTVNKGCILVGTAELVIGDYAMIGAGTKIVTTAHNHERTDIPMLRQGMSAERVEIGSDVWFGFDCIVLPGVTIGEGCIVAAGTVVTAGNYPPYSVLVGNPGRAIRNRLTAATATARP